MSLSNAPSTSNVSENWIAQFTADNKHCLSFDGNNVIISGSLTATEYSVTSSVTNIQIATLSGSTEFGNSSDDRHSFVIMLLFLYFKVIMILGFTINMMQVLMKRWLMREIMY